MHGRMCHCMCHRTEHHMHQQTNKQIISRIVVHFCSRQGSGLPKGPCDVPAVTRPVWRGSAKFPSQCASAILAAVLLRLRLPRLLPISHFHHEESPELEEGHREAQHGASQPCHQQGPNADILTRSLRASPCGAASFSEILLCTRKFSACGVLCHPEPM